MDLMKSAKWIKLFKGEIYEEFFLVNKIGKVFIVIIIFSFISIRSLFLE